MQIQIFNNTISDWLTAIIIFFIAVAVLKLFKTILMVKLKNLAKKSKTKVDDMVLDGLHAIQWPFYFFIAFYIALQFIDINPIIYQWSVYILLIVIAYYVLKFCEKLIDYGIKIVIKKKQEKQEDVEIIKLLGTTAKVILWAGIIILVLANIGYNVTSLVAGLGIGGIAVALALQNILSDLFSSLAIYFDKPLKVGDFVVIGDYMGTVKKIGIKTTRIQALQGEEIVISNSELTNAKLQNFGLMEKRRIVFQIGVTYNTAKEKLEKIPEIIKKAINKQEQTELNRVHFKFFGDFSLNYEIVYYVKTGDYNKYMDIQQEINLYIVEEFKKANIEFAFPTQTVHVETHNS